MKKNLPIPTIWLRVFLAFLVVLSYANGLNNDFTSDDIAIFSQSNILSNWSYVTSQGIYFIQPLLYVILYKVFGPVALVYRLISVLFHLASVQLLFSIAALLISPMAAVLIASIFAIHPLLVESVTWISGGPYAWSTTFFLIAFYTYLRSRERLQYMQIVSIFSYIIALTVGITATALAGVFVLYEYCFGDIKTQWKKIIPYGVISIAFSVIALAGIDKRIDTFQHLNAWEIPAYSIWNIPFIISKYLELYIAPIGLSHYQIDVLCNNIRVFISLLFVGVSSYLFFKDKRAFFGLGLFIVSLLPTLVPIGVHWLVADRYVYAGTIGLAWTTGYLVSRVAENKNTNIFVYPIVIAYLLFFQIRTILRNNDWENNLSLWKATVNVSPGDAKGHNNLANEYISQGNYQEALKELQIALQLNPKYSDAYHNIGHIYSNTKQWDQAEKFYLLALKHNPKEWQSLHNLALLHYEKKEYAASIEYLQQAIKINPQYAALHSDLGVMYYSLGQQKEANSAFMYALQLDPNNQSARAGYAATLR